VAENGRENKEMFEKVFGIGEFNVDVEKDIKFNEKLIEDGMNNDDFNDIKCCGFNYNNIIRKNNNIIYNNNNYNDIITFLIIKV